MTADIQERADIRKEQLDILYKNLSPSILTSVVMAIVVSSYAFLEHSGIASFVWLLSLFVVSAGRYATVQRYVRSSRSDAIAEKAYRAYNIGAFAAGAVWGLAPFVMFVDSSPDYKLFLVYSLASISAAALAGYSSSLITYLCFTAPIMQLTSLSLAISGDEVMFMMSLVGIVYFGLLTLTAMRMEQYMANVFLLSARSSVLESAIDEGERSNRQLQAKLSIQEEAFENEGIWTWEMDSHLVVTGLSSIYQATTGLKVADMKHRSLEKFQSVDDLVNRKVRELCVRMRDQQELKGFELPILRADGSRVYLSITGSPFRDEYGDFAGYRGTGHDITSRIKAAAQLKYNASHDSLTGLLNRREFYRTLNARLDTSLREGAEYLALVDLERLKIINETAGHVAGDELLRALAANLSEVLGKDAGLARVGGDEFALIFEGTTLEAVVASLEQLIQSIRGFRFEWKGKVYSVGASVGLVPLSAGEVSAEDLVRQADQACSRARESGGSGIHISGVTDEIAVAGDHDGASVQLMFNALDNDSLTLMYQPIADIKSKHISHFEVLLGLENSRGEPDSAGRYISAAEKFGAMAHFDRRVIRDVARDYTAFNRKHPNAGLFVNLSGSNLDNERFFDYIREQLALNSVPRERICFEITETAAINDKDQALKLIRGLKSGGCRFALDDFGTGLSSLGYLKRFPVDFVKMDGSFIRNLKDDPVDQAMLNAVASLGQAMDFRIVAESVEDLSLLPMLSRLGVDFVQGYAVGYPTVLPELPDYSQIKVPEPPIKLI